MKRFATMTLRAVAMTAILASANAHATVLFSEDFSDNSAGWSTAGGWDLRE